MSSSGPAAAAAAAAAGGAMPAAAAPPPLPTGAATAAGSAGAAASTRAERNARTTALIGKLNEADDSLAAVLDLAAQAIDTLLPTAPDKTGDVPASARGQEQAARERFEASTTDYFALLNDVQLFLRSAVYHLVHNVKRAPLTPAQTGSAFDALRAGTAGKGHSITPEDVASPSSASAAARHAAPGADGTQAQAGPATAEQGVDKTAQATKIVGLPDDAHLSLGALKIQHQAWRDLAAALEALQQQ